MSLLEKIKMNDLQFQRENILVYLKTMEWK